MINTKALTEMSTEEVKVLANFLTNSVTVTETGLTKTKILSMTESEIEEQGEEFLECVEGGLLDNYLTTDKNGNLKIYQERYVNCWTSGYYLIEGRDEAIWDYWEKYIDIQTEEE